MISFDQIPANLRVPGAYAEITNKDAGNFQTNPRTLLIGQSVNTIIEEPVLVPSAEWASATYGAGSQLALQVAHFKNVNSFGELWVLPLNDAAGAAATATATFSGTATASGVVSLYIGNALVSVPVAIGDTASVLAANTVIAVNAKRDLPVLASAAAGVVTLTAKNKGSLGNQIQISLNFNGSTRNEHLPAGNTAIVTQMSGGTLDPVLADKLPLLGNMAIAYYGVAYNDVTSLNALQAFLVNRWGPLVNLDGIAFTAVAGTFSALQSLGSLRNDEHVVLVGYEDKNPTWSVLVGAEYVAASSSSLGIDPARPLQTLSLPGVTPPKDFGKFSLSNANTLLSSGIAPLSYVNGGVQIMRAVTTYQKNAYGEADNSYLDVTTLATLSYVRKSVKFLLTQKFPRHKLAKDGTVFGAGQAVATPSIIKAEIIAWYLQMEVAGLLQAAEYFIEHLIVELDTDPTRVNIQLPVVLVNGLVVTATQINFKLGV